VKQSEKLQSTGGPNKDRETDGTRLPSHTEVNRTGRKRTKVPLDHEKAKMGRRKGLTKETAGNRRQEKRVNERE